MATVTTRPWDAAEHLETLEDVIEYLDGAREDGDPHLLEAAFADVMRSPAISEARAVLGLSGLALGPDPQGFDPRLPTLLRIALSVRLRPQKTRSFWDTEAPSLDLENERHVRVFP